MPSAKPKQTRILPSIVLRILPSIVLVVGLLLIALLALVGPLQAEPLRQAATATPSPLPTSVNGGTYTLIDDEVVSSIEFARLEVDSNGLPVLLYGDGDGSELVIVRCQDIACVNRTSARVAINKLLNAVLDSQDRVVFLRYSSGFNSPLFIGRCQNLDCTTFTSIQVDAGPIYQNTYDKMLDVSSGNIPSFAYFGVGSGGPLLFAGRCTTPTCTAANIPDLYGS